MEKSRKKLAATILVVDDNPVVSLITASLLEKNGYEVIQATSGRKALKLLETKTVDLIISDIQMPDGDGFEMLKELTKFSSYPPVILNSSGVSLSPSELVALGASYFLPKPAAHQEILKAVENLLRRAA